MEEVVIKSDDMLVMNLLNYFITEENYNPMIIHGITDEIWLENLNNDYKIIRIVSHHIHNKEQLAFDKFKLNRIVKEVKKKTLSFKVKVLSIYTDIEDDKILSENDIFISKEKDINNPKLTGIFPNIVEKTERTENGIEYFIKVTENINKKSEKRTKTAEKIFSYKKPIITYIIMALYTLAFSFIFLLSSGIDLTNIITLIIYLLFNVYAIYAIGKEIEMLYGKIKFIVIYIISGLCGMILSLAFTKTITILDPIGSIFGLLGALLYFGYYYRTYLGVTIKKSVIPIIIINLIYGLISGISIASHIGGLVGGILISMLLGVPDKSSKRERINGLIMSTIYIVFIIYLAFWR